MACGSYRAQLTLRLMPYEDIDAMLTGSGGPLEIIEEPVLGERMRVFKDRKRSLRELLLDSAAFADKPYIVMDDRCITYAEHLRQVATMAHVLRDRYGVSRGDRVAILAENHPEWVITLQPQPSNKSRMPSRMRASLSIQSTVIPLSAAPG